MGNKDPKLFSEICSIDTRPVRDSAQLLDVVHRVTGDRGMGQHLLPCLFVVEAQIGNDDRRWIIRDARLVHHDPFGTRRTKGDLVAPERHQIEPTDPPPQYEKRRNDRDHERQGERQGQERSIIIDPHGHDRCQYKGERPGIGRQNVSERPNARKGGDAAIHDDGEHDGDHRCDRTALNACDGNRVETTCRNHD
ncbi:hypothetical protein ACVOMT_24290 (plasmid) [Sphingomonas panni]